MKFLKNKQLGKIAMVATVSLSMLFSGTALIPSNTAYAYSSSKAQNVIQTAKKYLGTPYKYGAPSGSSRYFDCSSFTQYVFKKYGINLPRQSDEQAKVGKYVSKSNLKPGDLVFFYSPIHHVGIYIGNGKMINTYGKGGVRISDINSGTWKKNYKTARRVL
ncbi:C40 family peptidase [Paenibacillus rigui]|uniref:Hydrolase n=1 Tax=Paenibacillus rigui TaxID=554312 RepID=A0A229UIH6_9BACL|nr:C40 family peptidase [Paenibacillus rigui]OXM83257.1 hydrolase [Paenibacillus rigui]